MNTITGAFASVANTSGITNTALGTEAILKNTSGN
jgi:hypothetical protein